VNCKLSGIWIQVVAFPTLRGVTKLMMKAIY